MVGVCGYVDWLLVCYSLMLGWLIGFREVLIGCFIGWFVVRPVVCICFGSLIDCYVVSV
jgi:hypothetical protein